MTCLASDPKQAEFHAACYHNDMEPFMARGRALRAGGVTGAQVDSVRFREVKEGKLPMPKKASPTPQKRKCGARRTSQRCSTHMVKPSMMAVERKGRM